MSLMAIHLDHVKSSIRRFNKTAKILAAKASGSTEEGLTLFPVIVVKDNKVLCITLSNNEPDSDFYTPYVVNASFFLEILIKLILFYEKGEWVTGHNLLNLFEQVSTEIKALINETFENRYKQQENYKKISKMIKQEISIKITWNVASLLALSSNAFEHWRYAFDVGKNKSCFIGYGEIYDALTEARHYLENKRK